MFAVYVSFSLLSYNSFAQIQPSWLTGCKKKKNFLASLILTACMLNCGFIIIIFLCGKHVSTLYYVCYYCYITAIIVFLFMYILRCVCGGGGGMCMHASVHVINRVIFFN